MNNRISIHETVVFDGHAGWFHDGATYRLAVGGALAQAANGDLICSWLSGTDGEPARDNCLLCARSRDGGKNWSEPEMLMPSGEMAGSGTVMNRPVPDGRMVFFAASWPSEAEYTIWHYTRHESADHGQTWGPGESVTILPGDNVSIGSPVMLRDGRRLFAGSIFVCRPDPLRGDIGELARAADEAGALAITARSDETGHNKFLIWRHGCQVFESDPWYRSFKPLGTVDNRPLGLLEPSMIELTDGRLAMLIRAEWGGFLWRSDSCDGGHTWSPARPTDIRNPTTLGSLIRLADGRIALLHNDCGGVVGQTGRRDPLSLWISDDEMQSWSVRKDILRGGQLSYPCPLVTRDGRLVFGYDRDRRQCCFVEVDLD